MAALVSVEGGVKGSNLDGFPDAPAVPASIIVKEGDITGCEVVVIIVHVLPDGQCEEAIWQLGVGLMVSQTDLCRPGVCLGSALASAMVYTIGCLHE